jgi:hypothetical protein
MGQNIVKGATKGVGCEILSWKIKDLIFFAIWNHGNHGTFFLFNRHECQETQIKNPFDPILSFCLVKKFWKWKNLSLEMDIFTKDF